MLFLRYLVVAQLGSGIIFLFDHAVQQIFSFLSEVCIYLRYVNYTYIGVISLLKHA